MSEETYGPFVHGPNWLLERQEREVGEARLWKVLCEDAAGTRPVGYIRELLATDPAPTRFVAESLDGRRIAPERPTGPNQPLDDFKRHLDDC